MSMDDMIDIGNECGKPVTRQQEARIKAIASKLNLREDDALWQLLSAMEYQRLYYEELPAKITEESQKVLQGITETADREVAAAQAKLTESVVLEAHKLSTVIQYGKIIPLATIALVCVMLFGSMMLWAGYCFGTKRITPFSDLIFMPSGYIICALLGFSSIFCFWQAHKNRDIFDRLNTKFLITGIAFIGVAIALLFYIIHRMN